MESRMTQDRFFAALVDRFDSYELVELLNLNTLDIILAFEDEILRQQAMLEDELKYGH